MVEILRLKQRRQNGTAEGSSGKSRDHNRGRGERIHTITVLIELEKKKD